MAVAPVSPILACFGFILARLFTETTRLWTHCLHPVPALAVSVFLPIGAPFAVPLVIFAWFGCWLDCWLRLADTTRLWTISAHELLITTVVTVFLPYGAFFGISFVICTGLAT